MLRRVILMMFVLGLAAGVCQAAVALDQNFDGMTPGPIGMTGQGNTSTAGGFWFADGAASYPAIVAPDPCVAGEQVLQIFGNSVKA